MSDPITAQHVFDHVPIGAVLRYSDGAPRPPERHRRKLSEWKKRNGEGRLIGRSPATTHGRWTSPDGFVLHEGDYGSDGVIVLTVHVHYDVRSTLRFEIASVPSPGSVLCLTGLGDGWELAKIAADRPAGRRWAEGRFASRLRLEEVQPDGTTVDVAFLDAAPA